MLGISSSSCSIHCNSKMFHLRDTKVTTTLPNDKTTSGFREIHPTHIRFFFLCGLSSKTKILHKIRRDHTSINSVATSELYVLNTIRTQ